MDPSQSHVPDEHRRTRTGQWLPQDHRVHQEWLSGIVDHVDSNPMDLVPVLQEFKSMIENDTYLYLLFTSMFQQIPNKPPYQKDPSGRSQINDYHHMLQVLNHILTTGPSWNDKSERVGLVGLPINAMLDWPMGTPSGFALFLEPQVNAMIKKVLNAWGEYLSSPASTDVLDDHSTGWFGSTGKKDLEITGNVGETSHSFQDLYVCDPKAPHFGFKSWDHFFTRTFRDGVRPVAGPNDSNIIANACESLPYKVGRDIKFRDQFWLKGQPYSLTDMLAHDPLAEQFVGGTIYQAFLSALSYHRWHSPVAGKIVKAFVQDGTYYSEPLFEGFVDSHGADESGESTGQGYITATATRAIIFIEADNAKIGLIAFLGIGMAEVSTCEITVKEGQRVEKGEQLGMFHFGGSTHCIVFRKGVEVKGFPEPGRKHNVPVRSQLVRVT
ncbi:MAG: hypothetical protein Q9218_000112 [Villophora microphyllina]